MAFSYLAINLRGSMHFVHLFLLLVVGCGVNLVNSSHIQSRIVGGQNAALGAYPYQISLQYEESHTCGGAILSETRSITAAHCVDGTVPGDLTIVAGTVTLDDGGTRYAVKGYVKHPDYTVLSNGGTINDLAILENVVAYTFNANTKPIKYSSQYVDSASAVLTGWGYTNSLIIPIGNPLPIELPLVSLDVPNHLQYLTPLPIITNADCNAQGMGVSSTDICTFAARGKGACNGDSGGPLATKDAAGIPVLTGTVTYGTARCAAGKPDVYTRISEYVGWITRQIGA